MQRRHTLSWRQFGVLIGALCWFAVKFGNWLSDYLAGGPLP